MQSRYTKTLRYDCQRLALDYGSDTCQSLIAAPVEQLVADQVLKAVQPASLTLSLGAAEQIERERAQLGRTWQLRLERAQVEVERAYRQYDAVEPENRLVARTLEGKWEAALTSQRDLQEEHDRFRQSQPTTLTLIERAQLAALSSDLPALWNSPKTSVIDKRQIIRLLLEQVRVSAPSDSNIVTVECHWTGDVVTRHQVRRRVSRWSQLAAYETLVSKITSLQSAGWNSRRIAAQLNEDGFQSPRGAAITADNVRQLLTRHYARPKRTK